MSWLERTIETVSPKAAYLRKQYRAAGKMLESQGKRSYDGAAYGRRGAKKMVFGSANTENETAVARLRGNARDMAQNNAWAVRTLDVIVSNVIGTGIRCQPQAKGKGKLAAISKLWTDWAETTACDFDALNDFYGLQQLVLETVVRDGSAIIRYRRIAPALVPLQIQVLEADFLDITKQSGEGKNRVIHGIEVDDEGRRVAFWLYEQHPGDQGWLGRLTRKSNRIPADQVQIIFRQHRAGQLYGVSWLSPVMPHLRDLDQYEDAQLVKQKISAFFAGFIHDATGGDDSPASAAESELPEKIEPGAIELLPPGKDITFPNPPTVDGFSEHERTVLRKIAAGVGITYEALSGDYSQVNFSSGRMGWIEFGRNIEKWRWRMFIPQFCASSWEKFKEAASVAGNDFSGVTAQWTPPRRELIDPVKEIQGIVLEIRSGLTSWSEAVRERGYDPAAMLIQIAADAKAWDAAGLIFDCDPRKTTQQGQPRDKAPTTAPATDKGQGG